MLSLSKGKLNCLPYSRSLLDFFNARGIDAKSLVVRVVVFGKQADPTIWNRVDTYVLCRTAIGGNANDTLSIPDPDDATKTMSVPYRTIGFPHNSGRELGDYSPTGSWGGHLVVVAENHLIDLTIGQINSDEFKISFSPTWQTVEVDTDFLTGKKPIVAVCDGMCICYFAYPEERTYEASKSWGAKGGAEFRQQLKSMGLKVDKLWQGKALA